MTDKAREERRQEARTGSGMGVLTGALVMAFVGLIIVGMSAGIYLFGRRVISRQPQPGAPSITEEPAKRVDFEQVTSKMEMIQQIIDPGISL